MPPGCPGGNLENGGLIRRFLLGRFLREDEPDWVSASCSGSGLGGGRFNTGDAGSDGEGGGEGGGVGRRVSCKRVWSCRSAAKPTAVTTRGTW